MGNTVSGSGLPPILGLGVVVLILIILVLIQPGLELVPGGAGAAAVTPCLSAPVTHQSHSVSSPVIAQGGGSVEERMTGAERLLLLQFCEN